MAVASVPKGRKNSAKYLYWDELARALDGGHSVVIYQHFPRVLRQPYLSKLLGQITERSTVGHDAFALYSSGVAFLIVAAPRDASRLRAAAQVVEQQWDPSVTLFG